MSQARGARISVALNLPPYIVEDEIGIHMGRLNALRYLSGIRHLAVVGVDGGKSEEETPQLAGYTGSGEAFAGKAMKAQKRELMSSESKHFFDGGFLLQERWRDTIVAIDKAGVVREINADRRWKKGVRDATAWAEIIDKSLRTEISKAGIRNNLSEADSFDYMQLAIVLGFSIFNTSGVGSSLHLPTAEALVSDMLLRGIITNALFYILNIPKRYFGNDGYRMSIFLGALPEYALAVKVLSNLRLVKKI